MRLFLVASVCALSSAGASEKGVFGGVRKGSMDGAAQGVSGSEESDPVYPDSVVLSIAPRNLWAATERLQGPQGERLELSYQFLNGSRGGREYFSCPDAALAREGSRYPDCVRFQEAAVRALETWAEASGRLRFRRGSPSEKVNVYIAWLPMESVGLVVPNSIDPDRRESPGNEEQIVRARGFERAQKPDVRQRFVTMLFDRTICWHLDDAGVCPEPTPKRVTSEPPREIVAGRRDPALRRRFSFPRVALHESGHVMGFHHFYRTEPTVMGMAGSEFLELQDVDRRAVRELYDRALVPASSRPQ